MPGRNGVRLDGRLEVARLRVGHRCGMPVITPFQVVVVRAEAGVLRVGCPARNAARDCTRSGADDGQGSPPESDDFCIGE